MTKFKMLERGLLFYPLKDKGKKFDIIGSYTIELTKEDFEKYTGGKWDDLDKIGDSIDKFTLSSLLFYLEEVLYKKLCQIIPKGELKKADWIHPAGWNVFNYEGKTHITFIADLLREV